MQSHTILSSGAADRRLRGNLALDKGKSRLSVLLPVSLMRSGIVAVAAVGVRCVAVGLDLARGWADKARRARSELRAKLTTGKKKVRGRRLRPEPRMSRRRRRRRARSGDRP